MSGTMLACEGGATLGLRQQLDTLKKLGLIVAAPVNWSSIYSTRLTTQHLRPDTETSSHRAIIALIIT